MGQTETVAYDLAGNVTSRVDFNGRLTRYEYDDNMDYLLARIPDPGLGEASIAFTYHSNGTRKAMADSSGVTQYVYNGRDWLTSKQTPQGTLNYQYDPMGNLTRMKSSNGGGTDIQYDMTA